ncbi:PD-(D/E)XK nuclease family protein [Fulvivirga maritima]|uniref:PD-(D/E)XK nuclease family protein n=1 Tax=Fulvivirga maritima TaxID=2904247 RepID=UPI001F224526|nr:PD-(D/E)XK nuclease family protein [Fulvivirga maritima]UII24490.1 PD-(D/E)XK nuclease family protein [Fulvivirga maritima]
MKRFIQEIAEDILQKHGEHLADVTVIFPNRRAGLFLRESLRDLVNKPTWSPNILSFQDFIAQQVPTQVADKLFLTHQLFDVYNKIMKAKEGFDRFYYWGQMLLKDFDDVDKYLVNTENLYTNLSRQKQLDLTFDFLMPEQKEIIQRFWQGFDQTKSEQKERFEFVWDRLFKVYTEFQRLLKSQNLAYEGMQYRYVAENLDRLTFKKSSGPVIFAGFNALNLAEEKIISFFLEKKNAEMIWDLDGYYLEDKNQEAGVFLREYRNKNIFAPTFPQDVPHFLKNTPKRIEVAGVPQYVGQAKIVGQRLGELLAENPDLDLRKVAVVLADEALLFPLLHSLPEGIEAINVTMGFPLAYAPINSLIEHILDLQRTIRHDPDGNVMYSFKPTLAILRHPLVLPFDTEAIEKLAETIEADNKVFLIQSDLIEHPLISAIFQEARDKLVTYLSHILLVLHGGKENAEIEVEYIHHFYQILNRYEELLSDVDKKTDLASFSRLFKQLISTERLPFSGEPLNGLQIMGVLETRNLDFEQVFVLSMNEDLFPSQGGKHSFIPYNLRKAYGLPNFDQQDAIYAYLFYRLLQRASSVEFYYNTEGNDMGGEEMSRFLQQLIHESGFDIEQRVLANYAELEERREIVIAKDEEVLARLRRYLLNNGRAYRRLSPSALSTYLDCRLRFYYRYVADLYEKDGIDEDVDARSLGNVLHYAMEVLYDDYIKERNSGIAIRKSDFKSLRLRLERAAVRAFREQFSVSEDRVFYFEGKNIIAKEIIKDFMSSILSLDEKYAPFDLIGVEKKYELDLPVQLNNQETVVGLRGTIDRLDKKDNHVRLIDYKTGQDKHNFDEIALLFDRKKKNKVAFQTMYYALLYQKEKAPEEVMVPAVFNKDALFLGEDVLLAHKKFGEVNNAELFLAEYTEHLKELLAELFDPEVPFDQTDDEQKCKFCAYSNICARG